MHAVAALQLQSCSVLLGTIYATFKIMFLREREIVSCHALELHIYFKISVPPRSIFDGFVLLQADWLLF